VDRRSFLRIAGAGAGTLVVASSLPATAAPPAKPYFQHGLASGDPLPDRVILWTRVSPTAASFPGSSAGPVVDVRWQVATDPGFRRVVASGTAVTGPEADHTVKVDAPGLAPATWYWYRFVLDGVRSPVGRTRTAPAPDSAVAGLRLGVVSCANYEAASSPPTGTSPPADDLHAVLHLGDYLYEYAR
jgi:alkaline phosphatase D